MWGRTTITSIEDCLYLIIYLIIGLICLFLPFVSCLSTLYVPWKGRSIKFLRRQPIGPKPLYARVIAHPPHFYHEDGGSA
jgi:hypothetical protein